MQPTSDPVSMRREAWLLLLWALDMFAYMKFAPHPVTNPQPQEMLLLVSTMSAYEGQVEEMQPFWTSRGTDHEGMTPPTSFCLECSSHSLHYTQSPISIVTWSSGKSGLHSPSQALPSGYACFSFRSLGVASTLHLLLQLCFILISLITYDQFY